MQKIIERTEYIKKIEPYIGKQIIKVLAGARRVGKTTLLLQLSKKIKSNDPNANIYVTADYLIL